jgi:hypothetical protein
MGNTGCGSFAKYILSKYLFVEKIAAKLPHPVFPIQPPEIHPEKSLCRNSAIAAASIWQYILSKYLFVEKIAAQSRTI